MIMAKSSNKGNHCPVTCGNPLSAKKKAFVFMCMRAMEEKGHGGAYVNQACRVCLGKTYPAELTFTDEQKGEQVVSKTTTIGKPCESCNKIRSPIKTYGQEVCTSCSQVMTNSKNNPELVMDIFRKYNKVGSFLSETEQSEVCGSVASIPPADDESTKILQKENDSLREVIRKLTDGQTELEGLYETANKELGLLKLEIVNTATPTSSPEFDKGVLAILAMDLAEAHFKGLFVVKPDYFAELRKAATF